MFQSLKCRKGAEESVPVFDILINLLCTIVVFTISFFMMLINVLSNLYMKTQYTNKY